MQQDAGPPDALLTEQCVSTRPRDIESSRDIHFFCYSNEIIVRYVKHTLRLALNKMNATQRNRDRRQRAEQWSLKYGSRICASTVKKRNYEEYEKKYIWKEYRSIFLNCRYYYCGPCYPTWTNICTRLLSTTRTTISGIRFIPFYEFLGRNILSPNCRLVIRKR